MFCFFENKVYEYVRKLVEKYVGEFWFEGKYLKASRMNSDTMRFGMKWLNEYFVFICYEDDEFFSVDWILGLVCVVVLCYGICGFLIDFYNEFDYKRFMG